MTASLNETAYDLRYIRDGADLVAKDEGSTIEVIPWVSWWGI